MFAARGIAVSLSVFAFLYVTLSLAACSLWQRIWFYSQRLPARRTANLLFAWRMFPLAAAAALTLAFAVPSFLLLEPRAIDEPVGMVPLGLGFCGLLLLLFGMGNAARALVRASKAIANWQTGASVERSGAVRLMRVSQQLPMLVAAGILRPKLLISHSAEFVLTPKELHSALQHELAHVHRFDNLKKLLMCFAAFPGMADLEASWREAAEMAADDAAVTSASEALDLAAALIKMSRLGPLQPPGELTTALVHCPAASVNARVERLISWSGAEAASAIAPMTWYSATTFLAVTLAMAATYSQLLACVHKATEWLVR